MSTVSYGCDLTANDDDDGATATKEETNWSVMSVKSVVGFDGSEECGCLFRG